MSYLKAFIHKHKGKVTLALLLLLGQVVGTLLIPALIAKVVDEGILRGNMNVVWQVGVQMLLVAIGAMGISVCGSWATSNLSSLFGREMRSKLFRKVQDLSVQQFNELGVSSLITRSTSDITNLQQTMGMVLQMVIPAPIIVVVSMVMTWQVSPTIALIQLGFMAILLLIAAMILKKSSSMSHDIQIRLDRINKVVRESITGVRIIRAFGNETYEEKRSGNAYEHYASNMIRLNRLFAVFNPVVWLLMGSLMVIVLGVGGIFSIGGTMAVGEITAVGEYAILTMGYLMMGVATLTTIPKAHSCLERLEDVLNTQPTIIEETKHSDIHVNENKKIDTAANSSANPVVSFEQVTFAYPGAEEPVIRGISFTMQQGQTTAVIGSTGSGKSTLADLMLRLHDVQEGQIRIHGMDVRNYTQDELRARIGCVPQKAFLFSGTIAENLRMGRADATDGELWEALEIAQAYSFVKSLSQGLESPVSQGGTNFSGGQRQRISIARALVKRAEVFLFDDSFSALDVKTDSLLRNALRQRVSVPVKLIIAQRVSSIMDADQILVLDEGRLVGRGTHEKLMETCDVYRAIAESQMNGKEA